MKDRYRSSNQSSQTVFSTSLNQFCRNFLVAGAGPAPDQSAFVSTIELERARIFEQLMLFDTVNFKVFGENILVPVLIETLGLAAFEELLEQNAIRFTLWTPNVLFMKDELPGINALAHGVLTDSAHANPWESVKLGFNWHERTIERSQRRSLIRKIVKVTDMVEKSIAEDAVAQTYSAYSSGKLHEIGFAQPEKALNALSFDERQLLAKYAEEVMSYSHLMQRRMTSYSTFSYFRLLSATAGRLKHAGIPGNFSKLVDLEGFPNLAAMFPQTPTTWAALPALRMRRNTIKFRKWLATERFDDPRASITVEYLDAIADPQGFFETPRGKVVKAVALTAVGSGLGALADGADGALAGAAFSHLLEPAAHLGLDLLDEFVLKGLTKGWSPRLFFDDARKLAESRRDAG